MKKFALLVALLMVLCGIVYAEHAPGHLNFPEMPFLSETAEDDDPGGAVLVCFMITLGTEDVDFIPDFNMRILDAWVIIDTTDSISYQLTDGTVGNNIGSSFNTTAVGLQRINDIDHDFSDIDPSAGDSIFVDALPSGTTAEGHLYVMAVRIL